MKLLPLFLVCLMPACGPNPAVASSKEISGTRTERVAAVSALINRHAPLPSPVLDAHFIEEQTGDGASGPSDFTSFYALNVGPSDLPSWHSALPAIEPPDRAPDYVSPRQPCPWWLSLHDFATLKFHSQKSLTGRSHGWLGIAADGRIFIYTFTM